MNALDLILKKRDGKSLTAEEIKWLIDGYVENMVPDYQMSSFLMSAYFQGLNQKETKAMTMALADSGEKLDFMQLEKVVDKHSSGGVGDKTTLVLGPLVAAAGLYFAKFSGRGLGFTGGTIDKLESIPGFRTNIDTAEFKKLVLEHRIAIIAQGRKITPADKKIYSLRDVTGTVDSIPLIASSIMAKKIAGGTGSILLDVKSGLGAFMKNQEQAFKLAETMVRLGKDLQKEVVAVVSDMSQPLGYAVGNILEVKEAIATLKGKGPDDLVSLCTSLGGLMLTMAGEARNVEEGKEIISNILVKGEGLKKLEEMIQAQGGDVSFVHSLDHFPGAVHSEPLFAAQRGFVSEIDALKVGQIVRDLGAGRITKDASIDHTVGVVLDVKVGAQVEKNEKLASIYANNAALAEKAARELSQAVKINTEKADKPSLILGVVPPVPI